MLTEKNSGERTTTRAGWPGGRPGMARRRRRMPSLVLGKPPSATNRWLTWQARRPAAL
jgi:hypothetical protein